MNATDTSFLTIKEENYRKVLLLDLGVVPTLGRTENLNTLITQLDRLLFPENIKDFTPMKAARLVELVTLAKTGETKTAIFQIDGKANVLQHVSSIVRNKKILEMVSVIDSAIAKDVYTEIAIITLDIINKSLTTFNKDGFTPFELNQITKALKLDPSLNTLDIRTLQAEVEAIVQMSNTPEGMKIMRTICKKPIITKIYNAKFVTALKYTSTSLTELGIT
jgi:hypothetical protein